MRDLVKIGLTSATSEERAQQLSSRTGVPEKFIVVYDELVVDARAVEARMHARFQHYRVNLGREFFQVPVKEAIKALQEEAANFGLKVDAVHRLDITEAVRERWDQWLKATILQVHYQQLEGACFIEVVEGPKQPRHPDELVVWQEDLAAIGGDLTSPNLPGHEFYFLPDDPIALNAEKFLDLDDYTLFHVTSLFTSEAAMDLGLLDPEDYYNIGYDGLWVNDPLD